LKKLIVFILLVYNLFANNYETKLYEKVIPSIFQKKVIVYASEDAKKFFQNTTLFKLVSGCKDADIIVGKKFDKKLDDECKNKPFFATSYRAYRKHIKSSIGVFYWAKGRPQLKFDIDKIERFNLILPDDLMRYTK
jgi:hypothetical protein